VLFFSKYPAIFQTYNHYKQLTLMLPVGLALGLEPALLIGLMPAVYGYFFIPNYPSDIATVNFGTSGTTKIGKWYFNHLFMSVGLIGVVSACCLGYLLGQLVIG